MIKPSISIAPLMGYSDVSFCFLINQIAPDFKLYSEMLHANAVIHGKKHEYYGDLAPKVALQLGGCDPQELAKATRMACNFGFREINLNLGCPSPRVQKGAFGACLMKEAELVTKCLQAMQSAATAGTLVSIKCRTGVDDLDSEEFLHNFIAKIAATDCKHWLIHARKAHLQGLSPKANRTIPKLNYDRVYRLKSSYPQAHISINGGIGSLQEVKTHLQHVDGAMIGRWCLERPWDMRAIQQYYYPETPLLERTEVIEKYLQFLVNQGLGLHNSSAYYLRHLAHIYREEDGAKAWRRKLARATCVTDMLEQ
jgi:tRNA-dihydrouridine synthase A